MKKFKKIISKSLVLVMVFSIALGSFPENALAANTKIRQEINITNRYIAAASGSYATSSEIITLDTTKYTSPTYYFEVVASTSASLASSVYLRNATSGVTVATVSIPTNTTSYTRLRSSSFTPTSGEARYVATIGNEAGATKGLLSARVIILQDTASLQKTQTQIEIGNYQSFSNTATSTLSSPKYWYYDSTKWSTSTYYAEVSYSTDRIDQTYTTNGAYTWTATTTGNVTVQAWGAGAAGGGQNLSSDGGGGGGGGAFAQKHTFAVTSGTSYYLYVGKGGVGVASGTGGSGQNSSFGASAATASSTLLACGGTGGAPSTGTPPAGGAGGTIACGLGDLEFAGGQGEIGQNASQGTGGYGGSSAGTAANGFSGPQTWATVTYPTGSTPSGAGHGGNGGGLNTNGSAPASGNGGGGGGSGEGTAKVGGSGADGKVYIATSTAVNIVLQEDDGSFGSWTDKIMIVTNGSSQATSTIARSAAFTPTTGRNYRVAFRSNTGATIDYIYNAKIIVDQQGDLSGMSYDSKSKSVSAQDAGSQGVFLSSDGTKMYTVGDTNNSIFQYTLSTPYDVSSATYANKSFSVGTQEGNPWGVFFKEDGTTMYVIGYLNDFVYQYTLSTPWDVSTASYANKSFDVSQGTNTRNAWFKSDGTKMYVLISGTARAYEYNLSTAWDVSTASYNSVSIDLSSYTSNGNSGYITFNSGGSKMYLSSNTFGSKVYQFTLSTAWDLSTASYDSVSYTFSEATQPWGLYYESTYNKFYMLSSNDTVYQYSNGTAPTKLEPQMLIANTTLASGTSLQDFRTYWDPAEWAADTSITYYHEANGQSGGTSDVKLQNRTGPADVTNSTITDLIQRERSSALTMPVSATEISPTATTNNNDIYSSKVLVQVDATPIPTTTLGNGTEGPSTSVGPNPDSVFAFDTYAQSNKDSNWTMNGTADKKKIAHSFNAGSTGILGMATFYLAKTGSPTGSAVAKIYASTGTYGVDDTPTGIALATSDNFNVANLTGSFASSTFTFSGANKINLTSGTKYFVSIEYSGGDSSNSVYVGRDLSSPSHSGSDASMDWNLSSWTNQSGFADISFYVATEQTTNTQIGSFSLVTNLGTDTVTGLTVTLSPSNATTTIATIGVYDSNGNLKCSATPSGSNAVALSSCGISVTTSSAEYTIKMIPKTHSNMPVPPGESLTVAATVTSLTSTNTTAGSDPNGTNVTIDNASTANVSSPIVIGGDSHADLSWTNPVDSDFTENVVLIDVVPITDKPVEGINYATSTVIGTANVGCVTSGNSCTAEFLSNGTTYYFKIFSKDSISNYSTGINTSPSSVTPNTTSIAQANYRVFASSTPGNGSVWTARSAAGDNDSWISVVYGNGLFVAVSQSGDRVMTSPDGITWTARSAAGDNDTWDHIAYGNGVFVAVGHSGDRVMTSPDGITWTAQSAAGDNDNWQGITYGGGQFVAVGDLGDRVMTSPDGITWTARSAAGDNDSWQGITYGNGLYVAVGYSGDRVMTSPDGITWTAQSAAGNNDGWSGVTYGNGLYVAVGYSGDRVMTSPDGTNWTVRSAAGNDDPWADVVYGNGVFVAVSNQGAGGDRVMTSPDGITWTAQSAAGNDDTWSSVTFGSGIFVAVGYSGVDIAMTSGSALGTPFAAQNTTATLSATGESFRLRQLLAVSGSVAVTGARNFKLQYAQKSGTCDTGFSGETYADVTNTTPISFDTSYSELDGMGVTSTTTDPDGGRTITYQTSEADNSITTISSISAGNDGLFDFYLRDNGAPSGTSYCFRLVRADGGGVLDSNFGNGGIVASTSSFARGIASDGTYVYMAGYDLVSDWKIEKRRISNGSVDTGFGTSGIVTGDSASQYVLGMAADSTYMYVAGTNESGDWRIEKRLLSTGAVDNNFGTSGVVDSDSASIMSFAIAIDGTYMYVVGSQLGTGSGDWRIEKRLLSTGALDSNFGTSGVVSGSAASYEAQAVTVDNTYIYIVGRNDSGTGQIEKRLKSDGSLVSGFGTSGVITDSTFQETYGVATDTDYIYLSGYNSSQNWKIEKRRITDGALCTAANCGTEFGTGGIISPNTTTYTANELTIGPSYMFVTGRKDGNGWWTEKRLLSTGALDSTFGSSGVIDRGGNSQFVEAIINDGSYIYEAGRDSAGPTFRTEKITAASGNLDSYTYIPEVTTATGAAGISQLHYRWRNDFVSETSSSFLAAEDTLLNTSDVDVGDRLRLRFLIKNTSGSATGYTYRLETASSSCTSWLQVASSSTSGSPHWKMDASTRVSNGEATSNNSGLTDPTGSFVAGYIMTQDSQTPALSLTNGQFTELAFSIRSTNVLTLGTTYCFRLTNGGATAGFTYSQQPQIIIPVNKPPKKTSGGSGNAGGESSGSGPIIPGGGAGGGGGSTGGSGGGQGTGGGSSGGGGGGDTGMILLPRFFALTRNLFIITNDEFSFGYIIKLR